MPKNLRNSEIVTPFQFAILDLGDNEFVLHLSNTLSGIQICLFLDMVQKLIVNEVTEKVCYGTIFV